MHRGRARSRRLNMSSGSSYLFFQSLVTAQSVDDLSYLCKESRFTESETRLLTWAEVSIACAVGTYVTLLTGGCVPVRCPPERELKVLTKWLQPWQVDSDNSRRPANAQLFLINSSISGRCLCASTGLILPPAQLSISALRWGRGGRDGAKRKQHLILKRETFQRSCTLGTQHISREQDETLLSHNQLCLWCGDNRCLFTP